MSPRLRLLLVENDETAAARIQPALEQAGMEVTLCRQSADALARLQAASFDVIAGLHHPAAFQDMHRRLIQAAKRQNIGALAGGAAHELNNLLAGIVGYTALGLEEPLPPGPLRDHLEQIEELTHRAGMLCRQMLALARATPRREVLALDDWLRQTANLVRAALHRSMDITAAAPVRVEADPAALRHAVISLALNAPARSALTVRLEERRLTEPHAGFPDTVPPGQYALLEVVDGGPGMAPEVLAQCLAPFFSTRDSDQGSGLGLLLVRAIVDDHRGNLTLDSQPGEGTRVGLWLPASAATPSAVAP